MPLLFKTIGGAIPPDQQSLWFMSWAKNLASWQSMRSTNENVVIVVVVVAVVVIVSVRIVLVVIVIVSGVIAMSVDCRLLPDQQR